MASKLKLLIAATIGGCMATSAIGQPGARKYSAMQYFKNYALSTCIADGFEAQEVVKDAAAAARAYVEFGDFPLQAHTDATLLGRKFLGRNDPSMSEQKLTLMKCIDFFNSKELDELGRKYLRKQH
jgi:hypothetical protein